MKRDIVRIFGEYSPTQYVTICVNAIVAISKIELGFSVFFSGQAMTFSYKTPQKCEEQYNKLMAAFNSIDH